MFDVKIYKPNKAGKLEFKKQVTSQEMSKVHWDRFNRDNKYGLQFKNSGPKHYKVHKQCIEDDCTEVVEDAVVNYYKTMVYSSGAKS